MSDATAQRCPIGGEMIDEKAARINATITVIVLVAALATPYHWLIGYLVVDFSLKVFAGFAYSPNCLVSRFIANSLHLEKQMVDSAPKRFAAMIGLFMSALSLIAAYALPAAPWAFYAVAGVFLLFACMEAFLGFCMGCYIFGFLPQRAAELLVRRARKEAINV